MCHACIILYETLAICLLLAVPGEVLANPWLSVVDQRATVTAGERLCRCCNALPLLTLSEGENSELNCIQSGILAWPGWELLLHLDFEYSPIRRTDQTAVLCCRSNSISIFDSLAFQFLCIVKVWIRQKRCWFKYSNYCRTHRVPTLLWISSSSFFVLFPTLSNILLCLVAEEVRGRWNIVTARWYRQDGEDEILTARGGWRDGDMTKW